MKIRITWLNNNAQQIRTLVNYCTSGHKHGEYITMNSPIYKAIADGSFVLDLAEFGRHPFTLSDHQGTIPPSYPLLFP
jgi:hypothetical protein